MFGPTILARSLSINGITSKHEQRWQYHSRSDRHSKIASWGVAFDLLTSSSLLRQHAKEGKIVLGVNHAMSDFVAHRKKDLDLVVARPGEARSEADGETLVTLVERYGIDLEEQELETLLSLPELPVGSVGSVLIAMEAKATMTAHVKACPRLYDELSSSHACVHGESDTALAIGYAQINIAPEFISPNPSNVARIASGQAPIVSPHKQPSDTERVLDKLRSLRVRGDKHGVGFDAIGVTILDLRNDGSPVELVTRAPAPQPGEPFHYSTMIMRMATRYDTEFKDI